MECVRTLVTATIEITADREQHLVLFAQKEL
jgi:hypothetical protein